MTKNTIYLFVILLLALILAACGNASEELGSSSAEGTDPISGEAGTLEVPLELQLMLGTVLLDETAYAIDADQAAELLPLWKVLNNLAGSETAAQAEVDAVIASIQDGMTAEQISAIEEMGLIMADMGDVMETLGIETGFGGRFGEMDPEMQATMEAMRESGEMPERPDGGFGGGMGPGGGQGQGGGQGFGGQGFGGDTSITQEMRETAMAERGGAFGRGFGINTQLLEAIIAFLETK